VVIIINQTGEVDEFVEGGGFLGNFVLVEFGFDIDFEILSEKIHEYVVPPFEIVSAGAEFGSVGGGGPGLTKLFNLSRIGLKNIGVTVYGFDFLTEAIKIGEPDRAIDIVSHVGVDPGESGVPEPGDREVDSFSISSVGRLLRMENESNLGDPVPDILRTRASEDARRIDFGDRFLDGMKTRTKVLLAIPGDVEFGSEVP
jgi:hypothetical protein